MASPQVAHEGMVAPHAAHAVPFEYSAAVHASHASFPPMTRMSFDPAAPPPAVQVWHASPPLQALQPGISVAHDEHVVDVVVAAYSLPAHAVHVSVAASPYLWPAAHAVHVVASLHASQLAMAEAQDEHVVAVPPAEYSPAPHAVQVSVAASV